MTVNQNEPGDTLVLSARVIKTFLFTDIVKSTDIRDACIRQFGDKSNKVYDDAVLKPHDEILNRLIRQFEGEVISTAGDSYFCSFDYARDAIQRAVAIQREFIVRKIPPPIVESSLPRYIQTRIGLHRGGASQVLRAGHPNLSDHTINIAARIDAEKQKVIDALLQKYPELALAGVAIRYDPLLDQHPLYLGVAASTLSMEQGTTILISSLGIGQSERDLALTILHEIYHILHPEDQGSSKEERAEEFAHARWRPLQER